MKCTGLLICLFFLSVVYSCPYWELYKQCDSRWGNMYVGTSTSTICDIGCAVTDVAMALASYGTYLNNAIIDPASLNQWLTQNNGYAYSDLIIWGSVNAFGTIQFVTSTNSMTTNQLATYVKDCYPIVVNVRDGAHWVLITNTTSDPQTWQVNDPYYNDSYYSFSDMLQWIVYKPV